MAKKRYVHHTRIAAKYARDVLAGRVPAGEYVRLACLRQTQDLKRAPKRGYFFDTAVAAEACEFFPRCLVHTTGAWFRKPFELTPAQTFIVHTVHGWRREDDGGRRFTRAYIEAGRKFGKTEFAAGLALRHACWDFPLEPAAEVYLAATKEDQVLITTFLQVTRMIEKSPALSRRFRLLRKAATVLKTDPYQPESFIKAIGSDSKTSDGFNISAAVLDELHEWTHYYRGFYSKMTTAGGARLQECIWMLTTAGGDHSEIWLDLRRDFIEVVESALSHEIVADHMFGFIACIDEDDDPLAHEPGSPTFIKIMRKANPNYPVTPSKRYLVERASDARRSAAEANKFLRYHCGRRVRNTIEPFPTKQWVKVARPVRGITPAESCGAWDAGRSDDFAAWAVAWREGAYVRIKAQSYTVAERPEHIRTDRIARWVTDKDVCLIEHSYDQVDFAEFGRDIVGAHHKYNVTKWAFDEQFSKLLAQAVAAELGEGLVEKWVQNHRAYNEICRAIAADFRKGLIWPDDDPCLAWQAKNTTFTANSKDEWMPEKGLGPEYKIDAWVAAIMAYGLLRSGGVTPKRRKSFYDGEVGLL